ncbi:hypothetical protein TNCV_4410931 [Trichonephila clavipes]|nr:hypothetical protein TNCV_4410931 [Trichonephila clavipes]
MNIAVIPRGFPIVWGLYDYPTKNKYRDVNIRLEVLETLLWEVARRDGYCCNLQTIFNRLSGYTTTLRAIDAQT